MGRGAYAGVRADVGNSRNAQAQAADLGFFAGEDGSVFTQAGDGAGSFAVAASSGLQAQVASGANAWSAELRIPKDALGGWDHSVGLAFGHHALSAAGDDYPWPYRSEGGKPNTWAAPALGDQPVITSLDPYTATVNSAAFTLAVELDTAQFTVFLHTSYGSMKYIWAANELSQVFVCLFPLTWKQSAHGTAWQITTRETYNAAIIPPWQVERCRQIQAGFPGQPDGCAGSAGREPELCAGQCCRR